MADYFKIKYTNSEGTNTIKEIDIKAKDTPVAPNNIRKVLEYYFNNGKMPTLEESGLNVSTNAFSETIQSALQIMYDNKIDPQTLNNVKDIQISSTNTNRRKYKDITDKVNYDKNIYNQLIGDKKEGGRILSGDNDWSKERTIVINGQTYTIDSKKASSQHVSRAEFNNVLNYYLKNGTYPTDLASIGNINNQKILDRAVEQVQAALGDKGISDNMVKQNIVSNGGTITGDNPNIDYTQLNNQVSAAIETASNYETDAYNQYWNSIYNINGNGLGAEAYNNLVQSEINAGQNNIDLANAQVQQAGLAQAATVKNIVDQVRNERMARLRAGMSESQIANQDMQMMIANQNALNDQIVAGNMAKLQGQQQIDNAQTNAYNQWLQSMNQTAQSASAFAAADAGDLDNVTRKIMKNTGMTYQQALGYASGNAYKDTNK